MHLVASEGSPEEVQAGFEALIRKSPRFAEAYNQRAIFHFQRGDYVRAINDCEKALRLNPCHFRAALRIYRRANRINPNLDTVREEIESLERMLGEEGKR